MLNRTGSETPSRPAPIPRGYVADLEAELALVKGQRDEAYRALREALPIVASHASLAATGVTLGIRRILEARS